MRRRERLSPAAAPAASSRFAPSAPPTWEEFFRAAPATRQAELMALARHQGLLYAHQLAPTGNGIRSPQPTTHLLADLLAGRLEGLGPLPPAEPLICFDTALDGAQRDAVMRACRAPDICLIEALPGTGKSRVVAEIVAQSVARGERVLLLAGVAATLDRVLGLLSTREDVCAVRCLAADEAPDSLPGHSRVLTFAERLRHLREHPLTCARREVAAAQEQQARRKQDAPVLDALQELASRREALDQQLAAHQVQAAQVLAEVEQEAAAAEAADASKPPFATVIANHAGARQRALDQLDRDLADLQGRADALRQQHQRDTDRREAAHVVTQAKQQGRWWTGAWWRATLHRGLPAEATELEARCQQTEEALTKLDDETGDLHRRREQAERDFSGQRATLIAMEAEQRQAQGSEAAALLHLARGDLETRWQAAVRSLDVDTPAPVAMTMAATLAAREAFRECLDADAERCRFAADWAAFLEEEGAGLADRLPKHANLVASPTLGLAADKHFGNASGILFDVLVLQDAHQVTESEFLALAVRGRRWVLVGEVPWEDAGDAERNRRGRRSPLRLAAGASPPAALRPDFFQRLWVGLHPDPHRLPYRWEREGDRIRCRLRAVAPERRHWLESERVADAPDVELRILTGPGSRPVLAEVVFPGDMTVARAKEFLYRELEEPTVEPAGFCPAWSETPERLTFSLGDEAEADRAELEPGLWEVLTSARQPGNGRLGDAWRTARMEFARAAGWDRGRAEDWVERRLGLRDRGRTARLDVPHRMQAGLAAFLSDLLFGGGYRIGDAAAAATGPPFRCAGRDHCSSPVEFLAVPPLAIDAPVRRANGHAAARARAARPAGAGLELDLADHAHRDRLPTELRPFLPPLGLVNYLEAQAVVRALEALADDPAARGPERPRIAVLALYPAQVELIRRLVRQSPRLAGADLDIEVDVPGAFRGRESTITLLSLTRSHAHRAVSFGDGPGDLALALTRARSKLVLLGDAGTLARRCQWDGPVDHLDADTAARERALIERLVRYVQGEGPHQQAFHLCEADGP